MSDHGVARDRLCRPVLLVELLSVVEDEQLHLFQDFFTLGRWKALRSILFGRARIDLEEELDPVIVAIIVIALYFRVLAATRGLNSIIDANVDDLT